MDILTLGEQPKIEGQSPVDEPLQSGEKNNTVSPQLSNEVLDGMRKLEDTQGDNGREILATIAGVELNQSDEQPADKEPAERERPRGKERVADALRKSYEITQGTEMVTEIKGLLGDSDKIEGHQIDIITRDGRAEVSFKLTQHMLKRVIDSVLPSLPERLVRDESYTFQSNSGVTEISEGWVIQLDEQTSIHISKAYVRKTVTLKVPWWKKIFGAKDKEVEKKDEVRAVLGSARIEVRGLDDPQMVTDKIESAFGTLGINQALEEPDEAAERNYRKARFQWQHRLSDEEYKNHEDMIKKNYGVDLLNILTRQEVIPGYETIVHEGASEAYQRDGRLLLTHNVYNDRHLSTLLNNGLLSSHERYKRGIFTTGLSTMIDFRTGGADNVFIRCIPEQSSFYFEGITILIDPRSLDRTDWYAYTTDLYGTTSPETFDKRPSPMQFFDRLRSNFRSDNEIMMRRGIAPDMFMGIAVTDPTRKAKVIELLHKDGITEINGKSLDEFVQVYGSTNEYFLENTEIQTINQSSS